MIEIILMNVIFLIIWGFMLLMMSGCSGLGMSLENSRTFAVTKPPYQIVISGDIQKGDEHTIERILDILRRSEFKPYKFNDRIVVRVSGSETDLESLQIKNYVNQAPQGAPGGYDSNISDYTE